MAYDTLSPYAGAYPQTKEELDAQSALTRDVGVGSLRGLTLLTGIADIPAAGEWLARESAGIQTLSSVLPHLDRLDDLDDSDASYLHNLYLRSMGARGDPESQEKAKKLINPLRGEFHNRVEDIIDTIIPFETTERSNIIEYATIMATLGYGIKQIGAMIWRNRKNIPVLLDKMKNAIRKKEDPKAPLQIEHKPPSETRIDKTVERATAEKTPLQRSGDLMNQFLEEAGIASDIKISSTGSITTPKTKKASVLLEESLKKEQADLAAGKITRHSRGGLVENKVNYALNQWN